jgi:glyoxylase-like metal-dependent hydrolase (beta-lactamase superfamily II)
VLFALFVAIFISRLVVHLCFLLLCSRPKEASVTTDRRQFLTTASLALAGSAARRIPVFGQTPGQAPAAPPVTRFEDIRRNVGIFTGQGGTIGWLATPDGAVAVDAQFPATAKACVEGLQQRSPKGIQLLINTHYHGDHTAGNPVFRPIVKSIVQQERCAQLHKDTTTKAGSSAQQAYADVMFGESWSQEVAGDKVWGYYYGPGHTGGDAVIVFEKANVVHMGDLMFNRVHPRVDRPGGASIKNWINLLERVAKRHGDATFIYGHGKADQRRSCCTSGTISRLRWITCSGVFKRRRARTKSPRSKGCQSFPITSPSIPTSRSRVS